MPAHALLNALRSLARGNAAAFSPTAQAIYEALQREDRVLLNDLLGQVTLCEDPQALTAFDGLLNMFCTEPLRQTYADERQWRAYALTVLLRHPDALHLTHLGDMATLEAELARTLGIAPERVKCDPLVLPSWAVYDHGPLEAFQQCQAAKAWAEGLVAPEARAALRNSWLHPERVQRVQDALLLVNVHCNVDESADILERLQEAAAEQPALMLEAPVDSGPAVPVKTMLVDAGPAWSQFNEALHTVDTYQLGGALRTLVQGRGLQMRELALVAAYVEEDNDEHHTLRLSILRRDNGELLAGMLFYDLHEPEYFLMRADELLQRFGVAPVQRLEPTFYAVELEQDGDALPRFFVPAGGWQLADVM
jgi:hypothetical protein